MDNLHCLLQIFSIHLRYSVRIADVPGEVSVNVADVCEMQKGLDQFDSAFFIAW